MFYTYYVQPPRFKNRSCATVTGLLKVSCPWCAITTGTLSEIYKKLNRYTKYSILNKVQATELFVQLVELYIIIINIVGTLY